jgi:anti-sigma B factor antagonist
MRARLDHEPYPRRLVRRRRPVGDIGEPVPNGSAREFRCETSSDRGRVLVSVRGEIDIATAPILQAALHDAIVASGPSSGRSAVVADLAKVEFIDSSGIHALLVTDVAAREQGVSFVLRAPHARVMRVLDLLGLTEQLAFEGRGGTEEPV